MFLHAPRSPKNNRKTTVGTVGRRWGSTSSTCVSFYNCMRSSLARQTSCCRAAKLDNYSEDFTLLFLANTMPTMQVHLATHELISRPSMATPMPNAPFSDAGDAHPERAGYTHWGTHTFALTGPGYLRPPRVLRGAVVAPQDTKQARCKSCGHQRPHI